MSGDTGHQEKRCQGVPASPGIARGQIHVFSIESDDLVRYRVEPAHIPDEIARFENALIQTRAQIQSQPRTHSPRNLSEAAKIMLPGLKTRIAKTLLPVSRKAQIECLK